MVIRNMLEIESPSMNMLDSKNNNVIGAQCEAKMDKTIHSGHFMATRVHIKYEDDDDEDAVDLETKGFDFLTATKETFRTYRFGPRSTQTLAIDASLTNLFKCMTLAYSGKITSPKWNAFRGMHLQVKDKIRLNNIIWREWHMQYIYCKKPIVCQFATPLSDDIHTKPEAVVLEGKYWKRRLDTVTATYKKWRKYFKDRVSHDHESDMQQGVSVDTLLENVKDIDALSQSLQKPQAATDLQLKGDEMDWDLNIFASLNQPFAFPNPRELTQLGCSDLIQPGLMGLQPNLDDLMDIDVVQELLNNVRSCSMMQNAMDLNSQTDPSQVDGAAAGAEQLDLSSDPEISILLPTSPYSVDSELCTVSSLPYGLADPIDTGQDQQPGLSLLQSALLGNSKRSFNPAAQNTVVPLVVKPPVDMASAGPPVQVVPSNNVGLRTDIAQTAQLSPSPPTYKPPPQHAGKVPSPRSKGRQATSSATSSNNQVLTKRSDGFAVPTGKPVHPHRKHRNIAPAPINTATPSNQNTFLAQLLTKGTYPGALTSVKKEPVTASPCGNPVTTTAYQPILPADPSRAFPTSTAIPVHPAQAGTTFPITMPTGIAIDISKVGTDFPTSILIAAASQALGTSTVTIRDNCSHKIAPGSNLVTVTTLPAVTPLSEVSANPVQFTTTPAYIGTISTAESLQQDDSPQILSDSNSPQSDDPLSPLTGLASPVKSSLDHPKEKYPEHRRAAHITAEQKRRCNLKTGFDTLHTLIPALAANPKVSKATMLQKTADYCKKLRSERMQMQKEADILKHETESLNNAISVVQSQLPDTGVPMTRQRVDHMKEMFEEYVRKRTLQNWKFWIFSVLIGSLFDSYNNSVSTSSTDELCRTVLAWLDQSCSLVALRPMVLNALRHLSTTTSILTEPAKVKEQATEAVTKNSKIRHRRS
ncbi:carbohydrate-responsive element-binding protein-like [Gigantopelta aegis]|uniref:carbohydrate-responsive element-binding protein-like n=1 Tax=Gigantopelta aegis TaxID=1735272 RepID=UPI001B88C2C9|nr:carbohydrate-responsive element-binding protein-like [Gigantopelta aegis]